MEGTLNATGADLPATGVDSASYTKEKKDLYNAYEGNNDCEGIYFTFERELIKFLEVCLYCIYVC